jgi:hypothetical protein
MGSGRWLPHLLLVLAVACGGHSRSQPSHIDGGSASTGGSTSTAGPTSSAGTTASDPPAIEPRPCVSQSLATLCGAGSCPSSPSGFEAHCAVDLKVRQATTACGGTVIEVGSGYGGTSWYFDANGTVIGAVSTSDIIETCPDGHLTSREVYGTTCEVEEPWRDLCPPIDDCNAAPLACDGAPRCNETLEVALMDTCSDPVALLNTSSRTTCGGTLLAVDRGNGVVRYCFDAQNVLVGMFWGSGGDFSLTGSFCYEQGAVELACAGDPG